MLALVMGLDLKKKCIRDTIYINCAAYIMSIKFKKKGFSGRFEVRFEVLKYFLLHVTL